jgi:hypothetical protein
MRRRTLLQVGIAGSVLLVAAGVGISLMPAAWQAPRLSADGRSIFDAVARAVLEGALPDEEPARGTALQAHLGRVEETINGLPKPVQDELALLLGLLASAPGRLGLAGLGSPWQQAPTADVHTMLQKLRMSSLALRQQTYQALRDITYAAYFADRSTWATLGYAGPVELHNR